MDDIFKRVTLAQLTEFAQKYGKIFPKRVKKSEIIDAIKILLDDENILDDYHETFKKEISLSPQDTEEILQCTKSERVRWTAEGKLPVVYHENFHKFGKDLKCPYYDRIFICQLTPTILDEWRTAHKEKNLANRKSAVEKSRQSLRRNENLREYKRLELDDELKFFYNLDEEAGIIFELAFWTQWINRWAKTYELKSRRAIKYGDKYSAQKKLFYSLKNRAVEILLKSKYSTPYLYVPDYPDKVHVYFCEFHYQLIREIYFDYVHPLEAYFDNPKIYDKCPNCKIDRQKNFYALFCLKINLTAGTNFLFHTPHSLGINIFPDENILPKIFQAENSEGYFRFGRAVTENEMTIYPEKIVIKAFNDAVIKAENFFKLRMELIKCLKQQRLSP